MPPLTTRQGKYIVTWDSAGLAAVMICAWELTPGMRIAAGWRPWLMIERLEKSDRTKDHEIRVHFVGGHMGPWVRQSEVYTVIIGDPQDVEELSCSG